MASSTARTIEVVGSAPGVPAEHTWSELPSVDAVHHRIADADDARISRCSRGDFRTDTGRIAGGDGDTGLSQLSTLNVSSLKAQRTSQLES